MGKGKAIVLHIKSSIVMSGEEDQNLDLMTEGSYYEKLGSHYLLYEETEVSGMAGDKTSIKLVDGKVIMHRYGANTSELTFEAGKRYETLYRTPYGDFEMEILASEVNYQIEADGSGEVHLVYALSIKGMGESRTVMHIKMRAAGDNHV